MRILLPINEENMEAGICLSFGRAPFFLVWDTEASKAIYLENPGAKSSGGAGIKAAQAVADHNVEALIVPRIGKNASDVTDVAGITIYKSINDNVMENIQLMVDGKLEVLTDIHPGFHNHGDN
jgi:predicted Fe-Mo cluster-binding NifX family protein